MVRVGVVGAGFAGLAAAWELAQGGAEVVVLEARDRVGGRVWSQPFPFDGQPTGIIERGAEFVLEGYDRLRAHAGRAGLHVIDTGMSYYVREVPGVSGDRLRDAGQRLIAAARQPDGADAVPDLLARLDVGPEVAEALLARVEISCAYPADGLHAANIEHVASFTPAPSHRIAEGNQAVATALAAELGPRLHLSTPVRRIAWGDEQGADGRTVTLVTDADEIQVDRTVLTVPLPVLLDLPFDPPLPAWKLDALTSLDMGHAAKLHVPLAQAPRTSAVMSVADRYWIWTASDRGGRVPPILNGFAGSPGALDRLEVRSGPAVWLDRVGRLRPDLDLVAAGAIVTAWSEDPWARGAYSAWPRTGPDASDEGLAREVGRMHFAGEHTAGEWSGLMEGAIRSGERAAAEILARH